MINYGVILNIYLFEISVMRNLQIVKRYMKARESTITRPKSELILFIPFISRLESARILKRRNINHLESSDFTKLLQVTALSPQRTNIFYPF